MQTPGSQLPMKRSVCAECGQNNHGSCSRKRNPPAFYGASKRAYLQVGSQGGYTLSWGDKCLKKLHICDENTSCWHLGLQITLTPFNSLPDNLKKLPGSFKNNPVSLSISIMAADFSLSPFSSVHFYLLFRTDAILLST